MPLGQGYGTSGIRQGGLGVTGTYGSGFTSGAQGRGITGYGSTGTTGMNAIPSNYLQQAAYGKSMKDQAAQYNQGIIQQQGYYDQVIANQDQQYQQIVAEIQNQYTQASQPSNPVPGNIMGKWYQKPDGSIYWNERKNISTKDRFLGAGFGPSEVRGHFNVPVGQEYLYGFG